MKITLLSILMLFSFLSFANNTEQVVLHYSGNVVIPPCTIAVPLASLNFGNILTADFADSTGVTKWKGLDITLTDCVDVTRFTVSISAPVSTANPAYIGSTGTAEHIGIEAVAALETDTPIYNGVVITRNISEEPTQTLPLKFRLHNDGSGAATTGTIKSTVTLTYAFQ